MEKASLYLRSCNSAMDVHKCLAVLIFIKLCMILFDVLIPMDDKICYRVVSVPKENSVVKMHFLLNLSANKVAFE